MADTELKVRIVADTSDYDKKVKNLKSTDVIDKSQVSTAQSVSKEISNIKSAFNTIKTTSLTGLVSQFALIATNAKASKSAITDLKKAVTKESAKKALMGAELIQEDLDKRIDMSGMKHNAEKIKKQLAETVEYAKRILASEEAIATEEEKAKLIAGQRMKVLKTNLQSLLKFIRITLIVVATAGVAFTKLANSIAKTGNEIDKSSQKAGMNSQAYQKWGYVMNICGVEASSLQTAMKQLGRTQAQATNGSTEMAEAYAKLGISQKELKNNKPQEIFEKSVKALQNMGNQADRTAIATTIFGRNSAELNTILNLSNKETETLANNFKNLGGSMNSGLVKMSAKLQDSITNLKQAWQGVLNILGEKFIPLLKNAVEWLTQMTVKAQEFMAILFGVSSTVEDANPAGAMTDYTEAVEGAETETKKLLTLISGFDELNVLPSKDSSDTSSSSGLSEEGFDFSSKVEVEESKFDGLSQKWKDFAKWLRENLDTILEVAKDIGIAFASWSISKALLNGLAELPKLKQLGAEAGITITIVGATIAFDSAKAYGQSGEWKDGLKMIIGNILTIAGLTLAGGMLGGGAGAIAGAIAGFVLTIVVDEVGFQLGKRARWNENFLKTDVGQYIQNEVEPHLKDFEVWINTNPVVKFSEFTLDPDVEVKIRRARELVEEIFNSDDIELTKSLIEEFNALQLEGIQIEFDETTNSIKQTKEEVTLLIDELEKSYRIQGYRDAIIANYKAMAEGELKLHNFVRDRERLESELDDMKAKRDKLEEKRRIYTKNAQEAYARGEIELAKKYSETTNALVEEINQLNYNIDSTETELGKVNVAIDEVQQTIDEATENANFFKEALHGISDETEKTSTAIKGLKTNIEKLPSKKVIEIEQRLSTSGTEVVATVNGQKSAFLDFKKVQAYAKGGVVNTPTVAMVGEYANAKSNPEIITPESKMREVFAESNADLGDTFIQIGQQIISAINNKDTSITIGDETIARSASRGNRAYKQRTGVPLLV